MTASVPDPATGPTAPRPDVWLDHVGIDVRDLDRQTAFYRDGLALVPGWCAQLPRLTIVWLNSADGWRLELFHRDGAAPAKPRDADTQHDMLGIGHVALACRSADGVTAVHDRLVGLGATSLLAPAPSPGPATTRAYLADPEGNLVELVHLGG